MAPSTGKVAAAGGGAAAALLGATSPAAAAGIAAQRLSKNALSKSQPPPPLAAVCARPDVTAHHCDACDALQARSRSSAGTGGQGAAEVASAAQGGASRHQPGRARDEIWEARVVLVRGSGCAGPMVQPDSGSRGSGAALPPAAAEDATAR